MAIAEPAGSRGFASPPCGGFAFSPNPSGLNVALDDMHIAAEFSYRSMIPPTHASVRANADTGAARKIRTFQPVDDEPWSNQVMTSTPLVHVHSETPRLCVACHEHGTTLNGFLPVSWDLSLIHISEPTRLGMISYA